MGMDQELYKFRAIIGHQGPLLASDPDWKGSKYNVQVEWETGEITNRNMSKSKGWTLQSSLLMLWMEKTRVNNQTKIDDNENLLISL